MVTSSSIPVSKHPSHFDHELQLNHSHPQIKRPSCSLWASISSAVSWCFRNSYRMPPHPKTGVIFSIPGSTDRQIEKVNIILKEDPARGDELRYELIWKKRFCHRKSPLVNSIPYMQGEGISKIIHHLMSCEVDHVGNKVIFFKKCFSRTIRIIEEGRNFKLDFVQVEKELFCRVIRSNGSRSYLSLPKADQNICLGDRISALSKTEMVMSTTGIPMLSYAYIKKMITVTDQNQSSEIEVSLLYGAQHSVWQTREGDTTNLCQSKAEVGDVEQARTKDIIVEDGLPSFGNVCCQAIFDGVRATLLVGKKSLVWQLYEEDTKSFHQHAANFTSTHPLTYLANCKLQVIRLKNNKHKPWMSVLFMQVTKMVERSRIDFASRFDADQCAVTLVNSGESGNSPLTWGGHAKIIFEYIDNGKYGSLEAHFVNALDRNRNVKISPTKWRPYADQDRTRTYLRPSRDVKKLIEDIERQSRNGSSPYFLTGGELLVNGGEDKKAANCITWATRQLAKINIDIQIPIVGFVDSIFSRLITTPVQFTKSPFLKGNERIYFRYRNSLVFKTIYEIRVETIIQGRMGAHSWIINSEDPEWETMPNGYIRNKHIFTRRILGFIPIDILKVPHIYVQKGSVLQKFDLTKEIKALIAIRRS